MLPGLALRPAPGRPRLCGRMLAGRPARPGPGWGWRRGRWRGYQVCFFSAVRLTGVAIGAVVAIGSAPVFTGLISRVTAGPPLALRWMVATAAAIGGCSVLVTGGQAAGVQLGGVGLALLAGVCYAIYAVAAGRLIAAGNSPTVVMGVLFGAAAVLLVPVLAATSPGWLLSGRGLAVTAYLGLITTAAAYLLYGYGLRTVAVPTAVTLGLAEPVVAAPARRRRARGTADPAGPGRAGPGRAGHRHLGGTPAPGRVALTRRGPARGQSPREIAAFALARRAARRSLPDSGRGSPASPAGRTSASPR